LKGKEATTENFKLAAQLIANQTVPLAGNAFKKTMLQGAIEVALKNCLIV